MTTAVLRYQGGVVRILAGVTDPSFGPNPPSQQQPPYPGQWQPPPQAPAKRALWRRARVVGPVCGFLGLAIGVGMGSAGGGTSTAAPTTVTITAEAPSAPQATTTAPEATTAPAPAPADGTAVDGDWTASDIQVGKDFSDAFDGTLRLTGPAAKAGVVQLTLLEGGSVVAVLNGGFSGSSEGQAQTVTLLSTDDYREGSWEYELKVTDF